MTVPWLILLWPLLVSHRGYYRGYESSLGRTGMRSDQSSLPLCAVLNNCPEMQELWKEVIGLHGSSYQVFIHRMSLFFELIIPSQHFFNHLINMACDLKFSIEICVSKGQCQQQGDFCHFVLPNFTTQYFPSERAAGVGMCATVLGWNIKHPCPKLHAKNTLQSVFYGTSVKLHVKREPVPRNLFWDSETIQFSADVIMLRYRLPARL